MDSVERRFPRCSHSLPKNRICCTVLDVRGLYTKRRRDNHRAVAVVPVHRLWTHRYFSAVTIGTKAIVDRLTCELVLSGTDCDSIHDEQEQSDRERAIEDHRSGKTAFLGNTDVALLVRIVYVGGSGPVCRVLRRCALICS
ncbi:uncharacterized protein [Dermacentor andersoni]|uniref:uncharacterized protein isoform X1 n=1 Tax=Dermacentor andersoni TaxID=34620 RepID=UPI003B3A1BAB